MQVHLDALSDFAREAAAKLAVFGQVGWDAGLDAIGVANTARCCAILPPPRYSSSKRTRDSEARASSGSSTR